MVIFHPSVRPSGPKKTKKRQRNQMRANTLRLRPDGSLISLNFFSFPLTLIFAVFCSRKKISVLTLYLEEFCNCHSKTIFFPEIRNTLFQRALRWHDHVRIWMEFLRLCLTYFAIIGTNKTCVVNDPLGQTHSLASSDHYFLLFCFDRFEMWRWTDGQHVQK